MNYKCLIIDDEELARELIKNHLSKIDGFEIVDSCQSAIDAYKILQKQTIDLIFLDIEMPGIKGTDFFKNLLIKPKVIFTTAYRDYAIEGFNLNAVDYLLKPIFFDRFFQAIEKFSLSVQPTAITNLKKTDDQFIFIKNNKKNIKLWLNSINYIESLGDYIKIHLVDNTITIKHSLSLFEKKIGTDFLRVHRSYIINMNKITAFTKVDIEINEIEIPIGDSYKALVNSKLNFNLS